MTPHQLSLFSARNEAIDRAEAGASSEWLAAAMDALKLVCHRQNTFTSSDVWFYLQGCGVTTHDNRAMGPVFTRAQGEGLCEPTDRFTAETRGTRHGAPVRVWRSLLRT